MKPVALFGAAGAAPKIGSNLKSDHHNQVQLVQLFGTHCMSPKTEKNEPRKILFNIFEETMPEIIDLGYPNGHCVKSKYRSEITF